MLGLFVRFDQWLRAAAAVLVGRMRRSPLRRRLAGQAGQTTAEYALVLLAAAAVALVLIAWARSTGKLPSFFDAIIDQITGDIG